MNMEMSRMHFDHLSSCADLKEAHAEQAARSTAFLREFFQWATRTARPGEGAPKVLMPLARLADAGWLDGTLYVEVRGDDATTTLSIYCDHGVGIRERVVPIVRLGVPFDEFERAVRLATHLVKPLRVTFRTNAFSLCPAEIPDGDEVPDTVRLNSIAIDRRSLTGVARSPFDHGLRPVSPALPAVTDESGIHTRPTPLQMTAVTTAFLSRNGH